MNTPTKRAAADPSSRIELFREFLSFFWLRPENALLLALRAEAYARTLPLMGNGPAADVSCGDGVFSFITCGGRLTAGSDMFRSVRMDRAFRDEKYDAFDHFDAQAYGVSVKSPAELRYDLGTDWKDALLQKAAVLDFHRRLMRHDNNEPLPLEDASFAYVYSNSAYWVDNFEGHLRDLVRITQPGGHLVFEMKHSRILESGMNQWADVMGARALGILDAGRAATWRGLRSLAELRDILGSLPGTRIVEITPVYGGLPVRMWDIGLRPLFTPLARLANGVPEEVRAEAKAEWCAICEAVLSDYLASYRASDDDAVEHLIVLERS